MNFLIFVFICGFLFIGLFLYFFIKRIEEKTKISEELIEWLKNTTQLTDQKLNQQMTAFNQRLDKAAFVISQLQKNVGELSEIGRGIKELQQFLSSPKIRGNIGEQILKDFLKQYFPKNNYQLQYQFKNGEKVDAVIFTSSGIIPIDAKFPLENFKKYLQAKSEEERNIFKKDFVNDVKKHIQTIAKKYILPEEKTVDYALMYIPSEKIYYEIINDDDLFNFAGEKMVLPVSPLSLYAYTKAILLSFEGQKIEEKAKKIITLLTAIKKDYQKIQDNFFVLNKHLNNAYNQSNNVLQNINSLGQKLSAFNLIEEKEEKKLNEKTL
jgi:DNA recombination protein RmuC